MTKARPACRSATVGDMGALPPDSREAPPLDLSYPGRTVPAMTSSAFAAIGLVVADMPAAVAFYQRLGLTFDGDTDDHLESELAPGVRLMLDTEESIQPFTSAWTPPSGSPRSALAFQFPTPVAVDAAFDDLVGAGYQAWRTPWDAFWGHRYASVFDPDGNAVDLFAPLGTSA